MGALQMPDLLFNAALLALLTAPIVLMIVDIVGGGIQ
jgi:hypothetical protein